MTNIKDELEKKNWRLRLMDVRDALSEVEREERSAQICRQIELEVLNPLRNQLDRPLNLCVYAPFRSEASPLALFKRCWDEGDKIFAPRILPSQEGMELRKVEALSSWIPGKWGVPEPDPLHTSLMERTEPLDIVLVPGIAFDEKGGRLGYGGGYYDRLYAQEQDNRLDETLWIGFSFSNQVISQSLPMQPHDLQLDGLVTDEQMIWF